MPQWKITAHTNHEHKGYRWIEQYPTFYVSCIEEDVDHTVRSIIRTRGDIQEVYYEYMLA